MPTQTELIAQLNATVTKLTAANTILESRNLMLCKEIDLHIKYKIDLHIKHKNELAALIANYEILTSQLSKPTTE